MKFSISREALLRPLTLVAGVVERRQTLPVLSNVLLQVQDDQLALTGTDLEVELIGRVAPDQVDEPGSATVPARKLMDICKSLPEQSEINFAIEEGRAVLRSGRSRFTLSTLPVAEFPNIEDGPGNIELSLPRGTLKHLIDATSFAMAQQDVRYYLNGMLLELNSNLVRTVATDGHRLAVCSRPADIDVDPPQKLIVPRKGILELTRLLGDSDEPVNLTVGASHVRAHTGEFTFTSKLVDGKFPDYERVVPRGGDKVLIAERAELRQVLSRTSILSNEKYRGVRLQLEEGNLRVTANNPEQEEAEENVAIEYSGDGMEIGFNVSYLIDVLTVLNEDRVQLTLSDPNSSALMEEPGGGDAMYVVMPMRL